MEKTIPTWRPVIPHELRHEAGKAGAEHDLNAGRYMLLCLRHNLDRLGRLPQAFALSKIERAVTDGWDLEHSSLEQAITNRVSLPTHELTCPLCGAAEPDGVALLLHVCDLKESRHG